MLHIHHGCFMVFPSTKTINQLRDQIVLWVLQKCSAKIPPVHALLRMEEPRHTHARKQRQTKQNNI